MSIKREKMGEVNGIEVYEYTLDNGRGLCAKILNYGGIIRSLVFDGTDVVLGRDSVEEYERNEGYFGALIGRNSNRIENSEFNLNGVEYKLYANDGKNNLHGGKVGFDSRVWGAEVIDEAEPSLILSLNSPDGDEGFPGEVNVRVTYTLTSENGIRIHYEGECDKDTVLNMTNHSYFNLNGHASGAIDGHTLWLDSDFYTPNTAECIPTGEVLNVEGTAFDFKNGMTFGERFACVDEQVRIFGGIDHNFAINGDGYRRFARLCGDKSGIVMECYTDQTAVQVYTGNMIEEGRVCKDGALYDKHASVCLETQAFPNSLKYRHYPNGILKKGEKYDTVTEYRFSKTV